MLAEIGLSDLVIGQDFGRRARGDNVAFSDDISPLANIQCLSDIMVGDQDTNIARFEVRDDVLDIRDGDRVNPCKRFVQQDHGRFRRQRSRDRDAQTSRGVSAALGFSGGARMRWTWRVLNILFV